MAAVFDVGKLKTAQDAILDRIAEAAAKVGTHTAVKDLAEAFQFLQAGAGKS